MPRCEDGIVDLPSQEMCKMAASACRILAAEERHWISPLQCDDISRFPPMCKVCSKLNSQRELCLSLFLIFACTVEFSVISHFFFCPE